MIVRPITLGGGLVPRPYPPEFPGHGYHECIQRHAMESQTRDVADAVDEALWGE